MLRNPSFHLTWDFGWLGGPGWEIKRCSIITSLSDSSYHTIPYHTIPCHTKLFCTKERSRDGWTSSFYRLLFVIINSSPWNNLASKIYFMSSYSECVLPKLCPTSKCVQDQSMSFLQVCPTSHRLHVSHPPQSMLKDKVPLVFLSHLLHPCLAQPKMSICSGADIYIIRFFDNYNRSEAHNQSGVLVSAISRWLHASSQSNKFQPISNWSSSDQFSIIRPCIHYLIIIVIIAWLLWFFTPKKFLDSKFVTPKHWETPTKDP